MRYRILNNLLRLSKPLHLEEQVEEKALPCDQLEEAMLMPAPTENELSEIRQ